MSLLITRPIAVEGKVDGSNWFATGVGYAVDATLMIENFKEIYSVLNGNLHGANLGTVPGDINSRFYESLIQWPEWSSITQETPTPYAGEIHGHDGTDSAVLSRGSVFDPDVLKLRSFGSWQFPSRVANGLTLYGTATIPSALFRRQSFLLEMPYDQFRFGALTGEFFGRAICQIRFEDPLWENKIQLAEARIVTHSGWPYLEVIWHASEDLATIPDPSAHLDWAAYMIVSNVPPPPPPDIQGTGRLFCGFEMGKQECEEFYCGDDIGGTYAGTISLVTSPVHSGAYAVQIQIPDAESNRFAECRIPVTFARDYGSSDYGTGSVTGDSNFSLRNAEGQSEGYISVWCYRDSTYKDDTRWARFFSTFHSGAGGDWYALILAVKAGAIRIFHTEFDYTGFAESSSNAFPEDAWTLLQIHFKLLQSPMISEIQIYSNGVLVLNWGDNKTWSTVGVESIILGQFSGGPHVKIRCTYDDLVCSSYSLQGVPPDGEAGWGVPFGTDYRIKRLGLTGVGTHNDFTGVYTSCNEVPADDATTTMTETTSVSKQTFNVAAAPGDVGTILAVKNAVCAKGTDQTNFGLVSISNSVEHKTKIGLLESSWTGEHNYWNQFEKIWLRDFGRGNIEWTPTTAAALQCGCEVDGSITGTLYLTQGSVCILYIPV